jgi:hypothetical protein
VGLRKFLASEEASYSSRFASKDKEELAVNASRDSRFLNVLAKRES